MSTQAVHSTSFSEACCMSCVCVCVFFLSPQIQWRNYRVKFVISAVRPSLKGGALCIDEGTSCSKSGEGGADK